jgi:hypothetical protein
MKSFIVLFSILFSMQSFATVKSYTCTTDMMGSYRFVIDDTLEKATIYKLTVIKLQLEMSALLIGALRATVGAGPLTAFG